MELEIISMTPQERMYSYSQSSQIEAQTGCIGICQYEPVVEVYEPGKEKVTYVKMTPEMAVKVVNDHLVNGNVVTEYTIGAKTK